jgi:hypothetical protein
MRLVRSVDEVPEGGAAMPVAQLNELAKAWYGDRLAPDWRPRSRDESQALLAAAGLTGEFWDLPR